MVVQHNIAAMNSKRNLTNNNKQLSGNLEKLSSGYQINRSADDAAGLAISEKMRAQVTGLGQAYENVEDGIVLVKTGEGTMQEIHDMINRMKELAVQSANGTYDDAVDRNALQKEVDAMITEIDRVADSTNFNGIFMLNGGTAPEISDIDYYYEQLAISKLGIGEIVSANVSSEDVSYLEPTTTYKISYSEFLEISNHTEGALVGINIIFDYTPKPPSSTISAGINTTVSSASDFADVIRQVASSWLDGELVAVFGDGDDVYIQLAEGYTLTSDFEITSYVSNQALTVTNTQNDFGADYVDLNGFYYGDTITINDTTYMWLERTTDPVPDGVVGAVGSTLADFFYEIAVKYGEPIYYNRADMNTTTLYAPIVIPDDDDGNSNTDQIILQIGETGDNFNMMSVPIFDLHASCLGIDPFDISSQDSALDAISQAFKAVNKVSTFRAEYGALQNRLESTLGVLSIQKENIQAAESTIRDTDIAEEMMKYTKNNILSQSSQSMLAHSMSLPEGVLQLLG